MLSNADSEPGRRRPAGRKPGIQAKEAHAPGRGGEQLRDINERQVRGYGGQIVGRGVDDLLLQIAKEFESARSPKVGECGVQEQVEVDVRLECTVFHDH